MKKISKNEGYFNQIKYNNKTMKLFQTLSVIMPIKKHLTS